MSYTLGTLFNPSFAECTDSDRVILNSDFDDHAAVRWLCFSLHTKLLVVCVNLILLADCANLNLLVDCANLKLLADCANLTLLADCANLNVTD